MIRPFKIRKKITIDDECRAVNGESNIDPENWQVHLLHLQRVLQVETLHPADVMREVSPS